MSWLHRFALAHPWLTLAVGLLVTAAAGTGLPGLRIRTGGHALIPHDAPEVVTDRRIRNEFHLRDPLVILIRTHHARGIYNRETLSLVARLTEELQELPDVGAADVFSLATEFSHRVIPGSLKARPLLDPLPRSAEELDRLRDDLRQYGLYDGTLIGRNEESTAVMVGVPEQIDRTEFIQFVHDVIARHKAHDQIDLLGAPVAESLLGAHILDDLGVPDVVLGRYAMPLIARETDASAELGLVHRLRLAIARHVGLVPVAIGLMVLVFMISFRKPAAGLLPMVEVGACLVFVFGLMGWSSVPIYLTVAVMPVILTAIGVADEIHIFRRYLRELGSISGDSRHALMRTMEEIHRPVIKTSLTTAIGFCSFALSPLAPVSAFGIFTAIGIVFCMLWSLTVIPALLAVLPARFMLRRRPTPASGVNDPFARYGSAIQRMRWPVVIAGLCLLAAAPLGIGQIEVQDSWIDGFAPESAFAENMAYFNDRYLGAHLLQIVVDTQPKQISGTLPAERMNLLEFRFPAEMVDDVAWLPDSTIRMTYHGQRPAGFQGPVAEEWIGRIAEARREEDHIYVKVTVKGSIAQMVLRLQPGDRVDYEIRSERLKHSEVLRALADFESFLEDRRGDRVGGVIGIARLLRTANTMASSLTPGTRRLPEDVERAEWLWDQYRRIRGDARFRQTVSGDFARGLTTVYLREANFVDTARLIAAIRAYEGEHLAPLGLSLELAGDVAVSQAMIGAIVRTQVRSLLFSLLGILVVASILNRSLLAGVLCVTPCLVAVTATFAVMGWVSIPLGVATSMFAGMTLGVGVDYGIHLVDRYRRLATGVSDRTEAINRTLGEVGPAVTIDAVAVTIGFGVLTLSQVPANQRLGALIAISIASCLVASLGLLPALLRMIPKLPTKQKRA